MKLGLEPFELPLRTPLSTSAHTIERRRGILVWLEQAGDQGLGEATPLPGFTESYEDCLAALEAARACASIEDGLAATADAPAARHGLELAAIDLEARSVDQRLCSSLDPTTEGGPVPVNATVGDGSIAETEAAVAQAVNDGYRACKVKVGIRTTEVDRERIAAACEVAGDSMSIRVDANGAWSPRTAESLIEDLAALGVSMVEQPLPAENLENHAALRGHGVDIALDEGVLARGFEAIATAEAADVVVVKPMALGGIRASLESAREVDVEPLVTTTVDAAVARAGALHLAAALDIRRPCGLATGPHLARDVNAEPVAISGGTIDLPPGPGHGLRHDEVTASD